MKAVEVIEYASAAELFEALVFSKSDDSLFRGVPNAEYDLVPRISRGDVLARLSKKPGKPPRYAAGLGGEYDLVTAYEQFLIKMFYQQASQAGMPLPSLEPWVHQALSEVSDSILSSPPTVFSRSTPAPDLWPLLATMQHLGIETRLLDWTVRPISALFFASFSDAPGQHIAVWELPQNPLRITARRASGKPIYRDYSDGTESKIADCLVVVNPNLPNSINKMRQSGCFTMALSDSHAHQSKFTNIAKMDLSGSAGFDHRKIFEFLAENWNSVTGTPYGEKPEFTPMRCHVLRSEEIDELRHRLRALGVSGLTMLKEGFSVRDLCNPEVEGWMQDTRWHDA